VPAQPTPPPLISTEDPVPAPPVAELDDVLRGQAQQLNAATPIAGGANPAATPFKAGAASQADRLRAIECMTSAIYYEAGSESIDGQRAVAQVILNRVRHPAYPKTICGVVYQGSRQSTGCQFTFTCDGSLARGVSRAGWVTARRIAEEALSGATFAPVGLATHYHADYVFPHWAPRLIKNASIGAHIFYRWAGAWGQPISFGQSYRGGEPSSEALKNAALAAFQDRSGKERLTELATLGSSGLSAASIDVELAVAKNTLGLNNPRLLDLQKQRVAVGHRSRSAELAAVNAELASAQRTLGARHPRIIALQRQRALLSGSSS
jgi:spore germination cell wall hydrolase CwlJ-like protein